MIRVVLGPQNYLVGENGVLLRWYASRRRRKGFVAVGESAATGSHSRSEHSRMIHPFSNGRPEDGDARCALSPVPAPGVRDAEPFVWHGQRTGSRPTHGNKSSTSMNALRRYVAGGTR